MRGGKNMEIARRKEVLTRLIVTYRSSAKIYRELRTRYEFYFNELKMTQAQIEKFEKLFKELPEIEFFELETEQQAIAYLQKKSHTELLIIEKRINKILESYEYKTLYNRRCDFEYKIKQKGKNANSCKFGLDPGYRINASGPGRTKPNYIPFS